MVASSEAVLPWHSKTVTAAPQTAPAKDRTDAETALESTKEDSNGFQPFGEDGFSFLDLIDVINPLHHIPVIGPLYRDLTDDTIGPLPRIAGSSLFFGPIGAALASADVVLEETTGKDTGAHVLALFRDSGDGVQTAANTAGTAAKSAEAAAPVAAAGTDGTDPVTAWARAELAYRNQLAASRNGPATATPAGPAAAGTDGIDPVTAWAQAETAYRTALADPRQPAPKTSVAVAAAAAPAGSAKQAQASLPPRTTPLPDARRLLKSMGAEDMHGVLAAYNNGRRAVSNDPASGAEASRQHAQRVTQAYRNTAAPAAAVPQAAAPAPAPRGATASGGGWFADAMLGGLDRHQRQKGANAAASQDLFRSLN